MESFRYTGRCFFTRTPIRSKYPNRVGPLGWSLFCGLSTDASNITDAFCCHIW